MQKFKTKPKIIKDETQAKKNDARIEELIHDAHLDILEAAVKIDDTSGDKIQKDIEIIKTKQKLAREKRKEIRKNMADTSVVKPRNKNHTDNQSFNEFALIMFTLPPVDLDDIEATLDRVHYYFQQCSAFDIRPSLVNLSLALGVPKHYFTTVVNSTKTDQRSNVARKLYYTMESLWENYLLHGKVNPANGIFLVKNFFGYEDKYTQKNTTIELKTQNVSLNVLKKAYLSGYKVDDIDDDIIEEPEYVEIK